MIHTPETKREFDALVEDCDRTGVPLVVKFYATWCEPCKQIAPWFDSLAKSTAGGAQFANVDVDSDNATVTAYGIRTVPAFRIFSAGKVVDIFGHKHVDQLIARLNVLIRETRESPPAAANAPGADVKIPNAPILKPERNLANPNMQDAESFRTCSRSNKDPDDPDDAGGDTHENRTGRKRKSDCEPRLHDFEELDS